MLLFASVFASVVDLLHLVLSVTHLQLNLFEQSLEEVTLVAQTHLLALDCFDEKLVDLPRGLDELTQAQTTLFVYDWLHHL